MERKWGLPILIAVIFIGLLLAVVLSRRQIQQVIFVTPTPTITPTPTLTPTPTPTPILTGSPTPTLTIQELIVVANPLPNQVITSPLNITGQARGPWFFEAQAPVRLLDGNSQIIAQGNITTQGDWQTNNFVPFIGQLTFTRPTTPTGQLILQNDNPSGLPQNSRQIIVPVRF